MLTGKGIVVTRPDAQAGALCEALAARGARPLRFPALRIADTPETGEMACIRRQLAEFACVIFVSVNAVQRGLPRLQAECAWPEHTLCAAIGARTSRELARYGRPPQIQPGSDQDSESLLQDRFFRDVAGKRILIVRGRGGREWLADTLRARGATVDYAEVYQRETAASDPREFRDWLAAGAIDAVTVASGETLRRLLELLDPAPADPLFDLPLVVGAARMREVARACGFRGPVAAAAHPGEDAILASLETLFPLPPAAAAE